MRQKLTIFILALAALSACISDFTPDIEGVSGILVVEGTITPGTSEFRLSKSVGITDDIKNAPVIDNATLHVECSDGTKKVGKSMGNGRYLVETGELNPDLSYRLNFSFDGEDYQSTFHQPIQAAPIDSISYQKKGREEPVSIHVSSHDDRRELSYYLWTYKENWEIHAPLFSDAGEMDGEFRYYSLDSPYNTYYCWKRDSSQVLLLGTTDKLIENRVAQHKLFEIPVDDDRLTVLYHVDVQQIQIRKEAYEYFKILQEEIDRTGGLFSPVMTAGDNGNIFCLNEPERLIIGYVEVAIPSHKGTYLSSQMDLYFSEKYEECRISPASDWNETWPWYKIADGLKARTACLDCRARGGTKNRPTWWPNNHQ